MQISGRNQIRGTIKAVTRGDLLAKVVVQTRGGEEIVAVITNDSVDSLQLAVGKEANAVIKATEVMIATDAKDRAP